MNEIAEQPGHVPFKPVRSVGELRCQLLDDLGQTVRLLGKFPDEHAGMIEAKCRPAVQLQQDEFLTNALADHTVGATIPLLGGNRVIVEGRAHGSSVAAGKKGLPHDPKPSEHGRLLTRRDQGRPLLGRR